MLHNPEYRLTSSSGQDRSVKHMNYARTTDKGSKNSRIYSLISRNNKVKRELRTMGLRFNATAFSIAEGLTNALALANREGASPDLIIIDFVSYASLINELGAKVQYVQLDHDEVEVAFEAIHFHSAYGKIPVLADRSCQAQTAWVLTVDTWKLRTLGKAPHILTYGMEGLEGLRVGNADALEIRIAYYGNVICSAPGYNMNVQLSA
jgi:hypothetical protein